VRPRRYERDPVDDGLDLGRSARVAGRKSEADFEEEHRSGVAQWLGGTVAGTEERPSPVDPNDVVVVAKQERSGGSGAAGASTLVRILRAVHRTIA
jgi:hypothetical protein